MVRWDGRSGEFEHNGTFDLVIRRTYVPGWVAAINGGPPIPVLPVEGGLQSIRIPGSGTTRVEVSYHPVWLARGAVISLTAVTIAGIVVAVSLLRSVRALKPDQPIVSSSEKDRTIGHRSAPSTSSEVHR